MIHCDFSNVRERDMDLLFLEAFVTDPDFAELVVSKTCFTGRPFSIIKAELSQSVGDFGETDIAFVIEIGGKKYGLLIEDKVDAPAMPHQHERYVKRGEWGVKHGKFENFAVFIFCPEKYLEMNEEAQKYEHFITYETFGEYFDSKSDPISIMRSQQLAQAVEKAKKPASTELDRNANAFYVRYKKYQMRYYPTLSLTTKETANGWWPHYSTRLGNAYLYHKTQEGYVDLTFSNAANEMATLETVAEWLRSHGVPGAMAVKTSMSGSIRIIVPKLRVKEPFENTREEDLKTCFDAIQSLVDFANTAELARYLSVMKKK